METITITNYAYIFNDTGKKVLLKDLTQFSGQVKYKLIGTGAVFYHPWDNDMDRTNPLCILRLDEKTSNAGLEVTPIELEKQFEKVIPKNPNYDK